MKGSQFVQQANHMTRARRVLATILAGTALMAGIGVPAITSGAPYTVREKKAAVKRLQAKLDAFGHQVGVAAEKYNGARWKLGNIRADITKNEGVLKKATADLHISQRILSFTTVHDYFCSAAHPGQDVLSKTIVALDNGAQELALEDVLLVGDKARSTFGGGKFGSQLQAGGLRDKDDEDELLMHYRQTVFAPWLVNQFKAVHRREMSADSCDYGSAEPWVYADWYLASDGIHLTPSYPFALAICSDAPWAVITWTDVLANPGRLGATFARIQMGLR